MKNDMIKISSEDPDALNAATMAALRDPSDDLPVELIDPKNEVLPDTSVELVGGYLDETTMDVIFDVEVRELNGSDEEAIAKSPSSGRALQVILERGAVSLGGNKITRDMLDSMLLGDRDLVLLGIRRATYGSEAEYTATCVNCGEIHTVNINLNKDITVKTLNNPEDRFFTVSCRIGEVSVALPDGKTHRELLNSQDHTVPEMNSILLAGCIQSINGIPATGMATAKKLGISDREKISKEIFSRNPGPVWGALSRKCPSCESELLLDVSLSALFRL